MLPSLSSSSAPAPQDCWKCTADLLNEAVWGGAQPSAVSGALLAICCMMELETLCYGEKHEGLGAGGARGLGLMPLLLFAS